MRLEILYLLAHLGQIHHKDGCAFEFAVSHGREETRHHLFAFVPAHKRGGRSDAYAVGNFDMAVDIGRAADNTVVTDMR